jgi:hypothetical protein
VHKVVPLDLVVAGHDMMLVVAVECAWQVVFDLLAKHKSHVSDNLDFEVVGSLLKLDTVHI